MKNVINYNKKLFWKVVPKTFQYPIISLMRKATSLIYMGNNLHCPICEGNFSTFHPTGNPKRELSWCPRCGCKERHRLLWLFLTRKTDFFFNFNKVLHIAPMFEFQKRFNKLPNLQYESIDLYSSRATRKMDVTDMTYSNDIFDCIICIHVLEHVLNDKKAIKECYRVLKPGGFAIIQVPIEREETFEDVSLILPEQRLKAYGQKDHVRSYGKDFRYRLSEVGFIVKEDHFYETLTNFEKNNYGLVGNLESELIYFCKKQLPGEGI